MTKSQKKRQNYKKLWIFQNSRWNRHVALKRATSLHWYHLGGRLTSDVERPLGARGEVEGGQGAVVDGRTLGHYVVRGGRPGPADHVDGPEHVSMQCWVQYVVYCT